VSKKEEEKRTKHGAKKRELKILFPGRPVWNTELGK
jgi:hypothetical protein